MGLDDVRPLNLRQKGRIPIYGSAETLGRFIGSFSYVFESSDPESAIPKLTLTPWSETGIELFGLHFKPVLLHHGRSSSMATIRAG